MTWQIYGIASDRFFQFVNGAIKEVKDIAGTIAATSANHPIKEVSVVVANRSAVNASAWTRGDGRYAVTINLGLLVWAFSLASFIGRSDEDGAPLPDAKSHSIKSLKSAIGAGQLQRVVQEAESNLVPGRIGYPQLVFNTIVHNIFAHELGHIARGHLTLLGDPSLRGGLAMDELSALPAEAEAANITRQLIEIDADQWAMTWLYNLVPHRSAAWEIWQEQTDAHMYVYSLWAALLFFLEVHELTTPSPGALGAGRSTHPDPLLRFMLYCGTAFALWRFDEDRKGQSFDREVLHRLMGMVSLYRSLYPAMENLYELVPDEGNPDKLPALGAMLDEHARMGAKFQDMLPLDVVLDIARTVR